MSRIDVNRIINLKKLPNVVREALICQECGFVIKNSWDCDSCNVSFCKTCIENECFNKCFPYKASKSSSSFCSILENLKFRCADPSCNAVLSYNELCNNDYLLDHCPHVEVIESIYKNENNFIKKYPNTDSQIDLNNEIKVLSNDISEIKHNIKIILDQITLNNKDERKFSNIDTSSNISITQEPSKSLPKFNLNLQEILSRDTREGREIKIEKNVTNKLKQTLADCSIKTKSNQNIINISDNLSIKLDELFKQSFDELDLISFRLSSFEFQFSEENISKIIDDSLRKILPNYKKDLTNTTRSNSNNNHTIKEYNNQEKLSKIQETDKFNTSNQYNQRNLYSQSLRNIKLKSLNKYKTHTSNNLNTLISSNSKMINEDSIQNQSIYTKKTINNHNIPHTARSKSPTITDLKFMNHYEHMIKRDSSCSNRNVYSILTDFIFVSKRHYEYSKDMFHHIKNNLDIISSKGTKEGAAHIRSNRLKEEIIDETKNTIQALMIDQSEYLVNNIRECLLIK